MILPTWEDMDRQKKAVNMANWKTDIYRQIILTSHYTNTNFSFERKITLCLTSNFIYDCVVNAYINCYNWCLKFLTCVKAQRNCLSAPRGYLVVHIAIDMPADF